MIRSAVVAIGLLFANAALAHSGHLEGTWRVHSVIQGEETMAFPDALAIEGKEMVWARWLWVFEDTKLTLAAQSLHKTPDAESVKGKTTSVANDFAWCSNSIRVDIGWSKGTLMMPAQLQAEARVGRFAKSGAEVAVESCNIQLNGVQSLIPLRDAPDTPKGSITMVSTTGQVKFVLVPDTEGLTIDVPSLIR